MWRLAFLGLVAADWQQRWQPRVSVDIFIEAGCPYCMQYLSGPLAHAASDYEVSALMAVNISPFGNAYYEIPSCEGEATNATALAHGLYDVGMRKCFNRKCGAGVTRPPAECSKGRLICQHGSKECIFNRYLACAKHNAPNHNPGTPHYLPFFTCMKGNYDQTPDAGPALSALVSRCANAAGRGHLNEDAIQTCYNGPQGDHLVLYESQSTPIHGGVPTVLVNGVAQEEGYDRDALVKAVRAAHASGNNMPAALVTTHAGRRQRYASAGGFLGVQGEDPVDRKLIC